MGAKRGGGVSYIDGDVGIGTATPQEKLDVAGVVNAADYHKNGTPLVSSQWTEVAGGGISYDGGNVGIGTHDPRHARLVIEDDDVPLSLKESGQSPTEGGLWRVALDGGALRFDANSSASGDFSSFASPLTMTPGGNVGIGGFIWESSLSVTEFGQGRSTLLFLRRDERQEEEGEPLAPALGVGFSLDPTNHVFNLDVGGQYNSGARIHLGDPADPDNPVTTLGWVGIGTTSPGSRGAKLRIEGPAPADANAAQLQITEPNGNFMLVGSTRGYSFVQSHASKPLALNPLGNNVGIGTTTPQEKLDVAGNLNVSGRAAKPGGGSWTALSDIRLKKSVGSLKGALEKLLQLRGVSFEWREPEKQGNLRGVQMGLIAQEVEEVLPEWVDTDPSGYKNLTVRGFEALVVEAFKELNDEVRSAMDELRARIEALEPT